MAYVVISLGGEELSRHPLLGPTVMGRSADAQIHVRDSSMSRWHCRFEPAGDPPNVWTVVDLGSRNGTTVNGRRVQRHVLHSGDLLRVGRVTVLFQVGEFVPSSVGPRTVRSRSVRPEAPAPAGSAAGFARPLLVPDNRLPRPDPGKASPRRTGPSDLEMMSSPGWSRQAGKKPPSPSVDLSPGELSPMERQKTVDLVGIPLREDPRLPEGPAREEPAGLWRRVRRAVAWLFGR